MVKGRSIQGDDDEWSADTAHDFVDEGPGEHDRQFTDDDGDEGTIHCPHCSDETWTQAERCGGCGYDLSDRDAGRDGLPRWVWWTALVVFIAMAVGTAMTIRHF